MRLGTGRQIVIGGGQQKNGGRRLPIPGTFKFVCTYHRGMEMTVVVK
jgi:plastocyanin